MKSAAVAPATYCFHVPPGPLRAVVRDFFFYSRLNQTSNRYLVKLVYPPVLTALR